MTAANIENQRVNRGKGEKCGERVDGGRIRNKKGANFKARTLSWQKLRLFLSLVDFNRHRNLRRRYRPKYVGKLKSR